MSNDSRTPAAPVDPVDPVDRVGRVDPVGAIDPVGYFLGPDSPLVRSVPGFRHRGQQVEMARAIAQTLEERGALVAEAGTGTGKTFAYLVPALLHGGKVIVSTGTKPLQDQLFRRDLPVVREALGVPATIALLKGRANYVCLHHLERARTEARLPSRREVGELARIERFAARTATGDKAELAEVPEGSPVWAFVTSTRESCLGTGCPRFSECFVMAARRDALAADVVVVNHHLFFADVVLRDEGLAELLPACNTVILDEAHQLPQTATAFFGEQLTAGQLAELARDATAAALAQAREASSLVEAATALGVAVRRVRLALGTAEGRLTLEQFGALAEAPAALDALHHDLAELASGLAAHAERGEDLATCARRAADLAARCARWPAREEDAWVKWIELGGQGWQLHASPLSVADVFRAQVEGSARAWVFTSATLAVNGDFSLYQREMGLEQARTAAWASPFDYERQALLYVPEGMPEPNQPAHTDAVVDAALPVLAASGGRAFLLFTTLRALERARTRLSDALAGAGLDCPLLVQGEGSRSELLARFRRLGNAILLGSQTFWEGVDVRGEALGVVVIDKLPFAPPDDPVLQARLERLARQGGNPFMDYQLPQAAITLKQGAGRLIRSEDDRGVLMICDARLVSKPYGRVLWRSLPPMRRTRSLDEVVAFLAATRAATTA